MQLAAATAAKGTNRPTSGETRCRKDNSESKILVFYSTECKYLFLLKTPLPRQSPTCIATQAKSVLNTCFLEVIFLLLAWASWDQGDIHDALMAACG